MPKGHHPHRRPHSGRRSRNRREVAPGEWEVTARVERFVEPALLLALRGGRSHGYELAERLAEVIGVESVDYGNLYRLLRSLEQEGIVSSEWDDQSEGHSKREYELTDSGELLLEAWVESLRQADERIAAFLRRYDERNPT
ncbi:MAG: PadR family transcriptional regulator [Acidimicrobiia bacterium]|nr:PadR family transcriptional regulator [Acidimicrobiia bacterium]NNF89701.1 PadR family transcriptional regulator [Acidimicrobiia bacterium]NNL97370.1 PadR family transcriptional regulator [Acidimicrobiia bacterium]